VLAFLLAAPPLWRYDRGATVVATACALALGAGLSAGGRSAPEPRPVARSPLEPLISGQAEPLHGPPRRVALERACDPRPSPAAAYRGQVSYDFDDELLQPLPSGPVISERPRTTPPRAERELADMLEGSRTRLRDCYRWARAERPGLEAHLAIELRCDEHGRCSLLSAVSDRPDAAALARCVEQMLVGLELATPSLRATSARLVLRFAPSGQVPDRAERPRPPRSDPREVAPGMCFMVPRGAPPERLVPPAPILVIDDFDPDQVTREELAAYERKLDAWRRGGRRGPRPAHPPPIVVSCKCSVSSHWPDKEQLRRSVRYNVGRYRACYRAALARRPGLSGRVVLSAVIDQGGNLSARVQSSSAEDRPLEECLRRALEDVWFAPLARRTVILSLPFVLDPLPVVTPVVPTRGRPAEVEAGAAVALALGDGPTALRGYSALLRQLPDDPRSCGWRAGALESLLAMAPWGAEDPRVIEAVRSLLRTIATHRDRGCLTRSLSLLSELATRPHRDALRGVPAMLALAERMYGLLLDELAAFPHETYTLRYYRAEALYRLGRYAEAAPRYREVALPGGRYSQDAAHAQVIALQNALLPVSNERDQEHRGPPELARQLAAAIDLYLVHVPDAEERQLLLDRRARLLLDAVADRDAR
jgi:hypothetical protein